MLLFTVLGALLRAIGDEAASRAGRDFRIRFSESGTDSPNLNSINQWDILIVIAHGLETLCCQLKVALHQMAHPGALVK